MSVLQYISPGIPVASPADTGKGILKMMQDWHLTELALVVEGKYHALIKEDDLLHWEAADTAIINAPFLHEHLSVKDNEHPYNAACRLAEAELSLLPVVNEENQYLGALTREELFNFFCDNSGLGQNGGIIVLSIAPMDYSLSEIARICENNDAIILNVQLFTYPGQNLMDVLLKTGSKDLRGLKASFERYEYTVKEVFGEMPVQEDLEDRYRLLMNYINM
jgi:predicted transcriptional regulator